MNVKHNKLPFVNYNQTNSAVYNLFLCRFQQNHSSVVYTLNDVVKYARSIYKNDYIYLVSLNSETVSIQEFYAITGGPVEVSSTVQELSWFEFKADDPICIEIKEKLMWKKLKGEVL